jgi:predicted permease
MSILIDIVMPVFLLIGAGYFFVWKGIFTGSDMDSVMKFVQTIAIPCLLFRAIATLDLAEVFRPALLISYYTGALTCFVISGLAARYLFGRTSGVAVAVGFCAYFSNTVLLGLPIMERAYGADNLTANYAIISIHVPIGYLLGITCMEYLRADGSTARDTATAIIRAIFRNPLFLGLVFGFAVNLSGFALPASVSDTVELMTRVALPAALFSLGGILVRYGLADRPGEIAMITVLRLFVHPAITFALTAWVFQLPDMFIKGAVITAAMAPGINVYIFANMYDRAKGTAASSVLVGTIASLFSVTFWLFVLGT